MQTRGSSCKPWTWKWKMGLTYLGAVSSWTREMMPLMLQPFSKMILGINSANLLVLQTFNKFWSISTLLSPLTPSPPSLPMVCFNMIRILPLMRALKYGNKAAEPEKPPYRNVSHIVKVVDGMNAVRINELKCDVTLVAENLEITSRKRVLANYSQYSYALFTGVTERDSETVQRLDPEDHRWMGQSTRCNAFGQQPTSPS